MATIDLTRAASGVDMTEPGFITYAATLGAGTATSWSFAAASEPKRAETPRMCVRLTTA